MHKIAMLMHCLRVIFRVEIRQQEITTAQRHDFNLLDQLGFRSGKLSIRSNTENLAPLAKETFDPRLEAFSLNSLCDSFFLSTSAISMSSLSGILVHNVSLFVVSFSSRNPSLSNAVCGVLMSLSVNSNILIFYWFIS